MGKLEHREVKEFAQSHPLVSDGAEIWMQSIWLHNPSVELSFRHLENNPHIFNILSQSTWTVLGPHKHYYSWKKGFQGRKWTYSPQFPDDSLNILNIWMSERHPSRAITYTKAQKLRRVGNIPGITICLGSGLVCTGTWVGSDGVGKNLVMKGKGIWTLMWHHWNILSSRVAGVFQLLLCTM